METLWAPWRMGYILGERKPTGCIFCVKPQEDNDRDNGVLARARLCFVILNAFPYNPGHLMVVPYRHLPHLNELTDEELFELMKVTQQCCEALQAELKPDGFNIGMNLGRPAGAGIDDHVHLHVVPRWNGDTNFMPTIADTKVIPEALAATFDKLAAPMRRSVSVNE